MLLESIYNSLDEKEKIIARSLVDDINLCKEIDYPVYSEFFYTPNIWTLFEASSLKNINFKFLGLNEFSEKKTIAIYPKDFKEDLIFPIKFFKILIKSKFSSLEHRHFLGSILSLGIKREVMGDLIVEDGLCYGLIIDSLYDFLTENLKTINKIPIQIVEIEKEEVPKTKYEIINISVSSLRLDSVVSALTNLSRTKVVELIENGAVKLNYIEKKEKSKLIELGNVLTIKRYGKFIIDEYNGESKKNKKRIVIKKFI